MGAVNRSRPYIKKNNKTFSTTPIENKGFLPHLKEENVTFRILCKTAGNFLQDKHFVLKSQVSEIWSQLQ